jgi:hypothetical protein
LRVVSYDGQGTNTWRLTRGTATSNMVGIERRAIAKETEAGESERKCQTRVVGLCSDHPETEAAYICHSSPTSRCQARFTNRSIAALTGCLVQMKVASPLGAIFGSDRLPSRSRSQKFIRIPKSNVATTCSTARTDQSSGTSNLKSARKKPYMSINMMLRTPVSSGRD